ncbi:MAG: hypothetical protein IKR69_03215 [Bacteroidales bacterium]|nr:hypothetical protein [Bacteroidales bacterium]
MKQLEITRDLCRFLNDVLHETEEHVTSIVFGISEAAMSIRASFKNVSLLNLEKRADSEYESLKKGGVKEFIVIAFKAGVKHRITYVINDG